MRRIFLGTALGFVLLMLGAAPTLADGMPAPGAGSAFGQSVAEMSPGQGGMTGVAFGQCISGMANGTCVCVCSCPMPCCIS